jgi:type IV pilus assembly protein PilP
MIRPTVTNISLQKLAAMLLLFLLAACDYETTSSVRAWMDDTRKKTQVQALPLTEPKVFSPYTYSAEDNIEPFNADKLDMAYLRQRQIGGINPDFNRRREPLESFPIETVRMVGTISKKGKKTALLQVDTMIYQVQVGNYVGQNFGKIARITDNAIDITELIPDVSKVWSRRQMRLELQEIDND